MKIKWTYENTLRLMNTPFFELMFTAQKIHRKYFNPNKIQISSLLSIKTGNCPEDCKYCPQSSRYHTNVKSHPLLNIEKIIHEAQKAKKSGSTRFCMGAAWKHPKDKDIPYLIKIIKAIKKLGLETCMTLGELTQIQAESLSNAGLDYYNHNLDTSSDFYHKIITTRTYQDRLNTLNIIRKSGMKICSGGILGLGESIDDRINFLVQLANLDIPPESIPINKLIKVKGTPLENIENINSFEFIKIIAVTRIMMPNSYIRLSAGRENMNDQMQAMCFMAGANSIFHGCKLLTMNNPDINHDIQLFKELNLYSEHAILSKNNDDYPSLLQKKPHIVNNQNYYNAAQK
ncbi:MAG: biotin synthase BioB [Buchnera aphidicola (Eriosoma harunire)]